MARFSSFFKNKELTRRIAWGFPGSSVVKNPPAKAGDVGSTPGLEDPLEENMATHSTVATGKSLGQRTLEGNRSLRVGRD